MKAYPTTPGRYFVSGMGIDQEFEAPSAIDAMCMALEILIERGVA